MLRALLPLWLTAVAYAVEPPQEKAAAQQLSAQEQQKPADAAASRMESSLEKQRAAVRKQAAGWIAVGEPQPNESFLLPWPKPATAATNIGLFFPCDPIPESDLGGLVKDASERQRVSPKLVRAVIAQESAGHPCAVSTAGAQGLMQLMPEVQRELSVDDPFDPRQSIEAGAKLLRSLIDRYVGDLPKALAAYNVRALSTEREGFRRLRRLRITWRRS
jgi:soluble lytic murein transglycosylase-like protein